MHEVFVCCEEYHAVKSFFPLSFPLFSTFPLFDVLYGISMFDLSLLRAINMFVLVPFSVSHNELVALYDN